MDATANGTGRAGGLPPGSPAALAHGCRCPVLANASYRVGAEATPLLDPACAVHRADPPGSTSTPQTATGADAVDDRAADPS